MKKILLITMQDYNNIGNRLQNYALTKVLEKYGAEVTNLDNGYTKSPSIKTRLKNQIKRVIGDFGSEYYRDSYKAFQNQPLRREANIRFTRSNMPSMIRTTCAGAFEKNWSAYDLSITGSDQVWHNWRHVEKELPYYYLEFMPAEKRVSYAASFGFEELPEEDRAEHRKGLQGMHAISCRESSGCTLIKKETGRDAVRVLDPTLLLSANDWREVETSIPGDLHVEKGKYAFLYFLGQVPEKYQSFIDKVLMKRNIKVLDFLDFKNEAIAKCGAGEFLSLIDNAAYILTDSFHCTVFSTLFQKEFTVFRRRGKGYEKMFGRIEDLLQSTGHTDRAFEPLEEDPDAVPFDQLYTDSRNFLEEVLK
jgi:hypothetical protein